MPACPYCSTTKAHKDGRDRDGKQRYRCSACKRSFTDRSGTPFTHHRWPRDVIVMAVRWYLSYRLSAANVRNLLAERGLDVSRQTVADWVQKFSVLLAAAARRHAKPLGRRWFVDETYVRVGTAVPDMNLVCFRVAPEGLEDRWDELNTHLQTHVLREAEVFLSLPLFRSSRWLRLVLLNPYTDEGTLDEFFQAVDTFVGWGHTT